MVTPNPARAGWWAAASHRHRPGRPTSSSAALVTYSERGQVRNCSAVSGQTLLEHGAVVGKRLPPARWRSGGLENSRADLAVSITWALPALAAAPGRQNPVGLVWFGAWPRRGGRTGRCEKEALPRRGARGDPPSGATFYALQLLQEAATWRP